MMDNETTQRIRQTAENMVDVLETPINGQPSVIVVNREYAVQILGEAICGILNVVNKALKDAYPAGGREGTG